jgi:hypothetical protein
MCQETLRRERGRACKRTKRGIEIAGKERERKINREEGREGWPRYICSQSEGDDGPRIYGEARKRKGGGAYNRRLV